MWNHKLHRSINLKNVKKDLVLGLKRSSSRNDKGRDDKSVLPIYKVRYPVPFWNCDSYFQYFNVLLSWSLDSVTHVLSRGLVHRAVNAVDVGCRSAEQQRPTWMKRCSDKWQGRRLCCQSCLKALKWMLCQCVWGCLRAVWMRLASWGLWTVRPEVILCTAAVRPIPLAAVPPALNGFPLTHKKRDVTSILLRSVT